MYFLLDCIFSTTTFLVLVLSVLIYVFFTWNNDYFKKNNIPFLKPKFFFGNHKDRFLMKISHSEFYEDMYNKLDPHPFGGFFEGRRPVVLLRDPEVIRQIFVRDFDSFSDRLMMPIRPNSPLESNIMLMQGHRWKDLRSLSTPAFTSGKLKQMVPLIHRCTEQMTQFLAKGTGQEVEVNDLFSRYTSDVIASCAYGLECDSLSNPDGEFVHHVRRFRTFSALQKVALFLSVLLLGSPRLARLLRVQYVVKETEAYLTALLHMMRTRREQEYREAVDRGESPVGRGDFLQIMLDAQAGRLDSKYSRLVEHDQYDRDAVLHGHERTKPASEIVTDAVVLGQSILFLVAGFETTSLHMTFTAYELALNPEIQERARREVREALAAHPRDLYTALQRMNYLENILNESLRLHSPSARTGRKCTVDEYVIPGTNSKIHRGVTIAICPRGVHLDPKHFPDPLKFDPDRFLPENKNKRSPYAFQPFGHGPRNCIGMRFALLNAKLAMVQLLSGFRIERCAGTQVPYPICTKKDLLHAKNGIILRFVKL